METTTKISPVTFSAKGVDPQDDCPLFSRLPGEIRDMIFSYALTEYEDTANAYDEATCYKRPECAAPRRTDTALVQTCKAIYNEAWFRPWTNAEHSFYLAWQGRRPDRATQVDEMQKALDAIYAHRGEEDTAHVRVYAQLCSLEHGGDLQRILDMNHFYPRVMTIIVRHTDFWSWEEDADLRVGARWVNRCKFPRSLQELRVTFESLERKRDNILDIADQAIQLWVFQRQDDVCLMPGAPAETERWTGSSTWEGNRWIRDERRPNELDYFMATVTWRPATVPKPAPTDTQVLYSANMASVDQLWASVRCRDLEKWGLPASASAEEIYFYLEENDPHDTESGGAENGGYGHYPGTDESDGFEDEDEDEDEVVVQEEEDDDDNDDDDEEGEEGEQKPIVAFESHPTR